MVGKTLGHYEILEHLGGGGMGDVYAARDTRLNRQVAIKILPEEFAARQDRRQRFEREAKTVASLSHPNIVTIHSVEEADGHPFIVMELVRGDTLGELIPGDGMPLERFFRIALPLADAIHAAHMRGVSHRDLKPNNVMVGEDGRVKVLDFGLAKVMAPETDPAGLTRAATDNLTAEGRILGTVAYMSPEQAEGKPLDHRSDLFSLGILLYEMLTGSRPFVGDTDISVLSSILKDEPRPLNDLRGELPLALQRILDRALARSPDRRYQSAADLRRDLEGLERDLDTGELLAGASTASRAPTRPRWLPLAGLGAAAVIVIALLAWLSPSDHPPPVTGTRSAGDATAPGDAATVGAPLSRDDSRPSVAVFYFDNLSGDEDLDWLRTGLTDMLVTQLSQSPELRVLGTDRLHQLLESLGRREDPTTSFDVVSAVAREAGVTTSVVGSFLREDERLRISARVQDVRDGRVLWSETVEGAADESILDLVDTLASRIRATFEAPAAGDPNLRVAADEPRDLRQVSSANLEAWKHYTDALRTEEEAGPEAAIPKLEEAIRDDPEFATALAKLSELHAALGDTDLSAEYASRALEKAERLPTAERMFLEGRISIFEPDALGEGIETLQKTIEVFPEHRGARADLAGALLAQGGKVDEAIAQLEQIRQRGGMDLRVATMLAHAYGSTGDVEQGRELLQEYVRKHPQEAAASRALADYALRWERTDRTQEVLTEVTRRLPSDPAAAAMRWIGLVLAERWEEARTVAAQASESADPAAAWSGHRQLAALELYRGELEAGITRLRAGLEAIPDDHSAAAEARADASEMLLFLPRPELARDLAERGLELGSPSPQVGLDLLRLAAITARQAGDTAAAQSHERSFRDRLVRASLPAGLKEIELQRLQGQLAAVTGDFALAAQRLTAVVGANVAVAPRLSRLPGTRRTGAVLGRPQRDVQSTYLLARALWELDRRDEAAVHLRTVAEAGPDRAFAPVAFVRTLYYLGRYLEGTGDTRSAARYYRSFLELRDNTDADAELVREARGALSRITPGP